MRYNPDTEKGVSIDEIARQCSAAIQVVTEPTCHWAAIAQQTREPVGTYYNRSFVAFCENCHDKEVAEAMGNWPEARRLRAQVITSLC